MTSPPPAPRLVDRVIDNPWLLLAAALVFVVALRAPGFTHHVFNPDESYVQTEARVVLHGGHLYRDVVDRKPPGVPLLVAATMRVTGTQSVLVYRLLSMAAMAVTAALLGREARSRFGRRAVLPAAVLFVVAAVALSGTSTMQAANEETFVILAMVAALVAARRDHLWLAGGAIALGLLTRQTAALLIPAVAAAAWPAHRWRGLVRLAVPTLVAFPLIAALVGWRDFWFWNGGAASTGYLSLPHDTNFTVATLRIVGLRVLAAVAALLVLLVAGARRWRANLDLWWWVAGAAVACCLGLRFLDHYFVQLLPALVLLAAAGWDQLATTGARMAVAAVAVFPAVFGVYDGWVVVHSTDFAPQVAAVVRQHTSAHDRIFVWGSFAELYTRTDRLPATRFITAGFLTGHSPGRPPGERGEQPVAHAWSDFAADVAAHPPRLIIDTAPSDLRDASYYPVDGYPVLRRLIHAHYHQILVTDAGMVIYEHD